MTRDRSDAIIVRYDPVEGDPRRLRFEPRATGEANWTRYTEKWNGCQWYVEGSEPVDDVTVATPDDELGATVVGP